MMLFGRSVEHDLTFLRVQLTEWNIRADAHLADDVLHQRPHERAPWGDSAIVDAQ